MSETRKTLAKYIREKKKVESYLGTIELIEQIGTGGNGVVYSGILNKSEIAIKFFVEKGTTKLTRFKAEFYNIQMLSADENIVKLINYEELHIDDGDEKNVIPYILMKKYTKSLKKYRNTEGFSEEVFNKLYKFLIQVVKSIHNEGIIHRDIKPENILVTENEEFVLTDFGIAFYNPELFGLKAQTQKGDRMGNYEFSAPEQAIKESVVAPTMDIYAIGQLLQWYCFESTHRGTGRKSIQGLVEGMNGGIINSIINKCLANDISSRFQSIEEIELYYKSELERQKKPDAFDEMGKFSIALRKTSLTQYRKPHYISSASKIEKLIHNINEQSFKCDLEFNTGIGDNSISSISYVGDKKILMDYREFELKGVWIYCDDNIYDDIMLLDCVRYNYENNSEDLPISMVHISCDDFDEVVAVPAGNIDSGFVEINDTVYDINELNIKTIVPNYSYKYVAVGTNYHSTILQVNDPYIDDLQDKELCDKDISNLRKNISKNKHREVFSRL